MKKILLPLLFLSQASWSKCELPKETTLKIGCAYECGLANTVRLKMAAVLNGYSLELIDMKTDLGLMDKMDGIIIPGGADIHPRFYRDQVDKFAQNRIDKFKSFYRPSEEGEIRDVYELQLLKTYSENEAYAKTPLLGICRGMQLMGVEQGLPLHQDIETEFKIPNREWLFDKVSIPKGPTVMSSLFPDGTFYATKKHHQSINSSYYNNNSQKFSKIRLTAFSHDKAIVEALEYIHRPALGVQFHPELSLPSQIFDWFLNKACENKIN